MADVKWIKITTDIFDDEKMLLIESLPEADSIIVIWFKLLCLAGKMNNSGVFMMNNRIAYTDKMLSTIFRRKESTVQLALQTFEQFGMIEMVDNVITVPNWDKHQSLDSYEKKKERDRLYQQERRQRQKKLASQSSDCQTTQSSDVAISDKKESREDKNRLEERESIKEEQPAPTPTPQPITYELLINKYGKSFVDERIARAKRYSNTTIETVAKWCEEDAKKHKSNNFNNFPQSNTTIDEAALISNNGGIILPD
nr:MAG TPA: replisome organizer [Caudoviricetes sp.]